MEKFDVIRKKFQNIENQTNFRVYRTTEREFFVATIYLQLSYLRSLFSPGSF